MSIEQHKQEILDGNGANVMDRFYDNDAPVVDYHIWNAYVSGDHAQLGHVVAKYMDTLVFSVAADMDEFEKSRRRA